MLVLMDVLFWFTLQKTKSSKKLKGKKMMFQGPKHLPKKYHQEKPVGKTSSKKSNVAKSLGRPSTSKRLSSSPPLLRVVSGHNLGHQVSCHRSSNGSRSRVNDHGKSTLPETNVFAPENGPGPKRKRSYSNHPFSGAMCKGFLLPLPLC